LRTAESATNTSYAATSPPATRGSSRWYVIPVRAWPAAAGAQAAAAGPSEVLTVLGRLSEHKRGGPLTRTADSYERIARDLHRAQPRPTDRPTDRR
jgi:hypothetical protein